MAGAHPHQLPLDLGHRAAMEREDFMVAPSNAQAVGWIDRWPDWPAPALVLYGPPGCGKTHLAAVWAEKSGMPVIDDAEQMIGTREWESDLFHLYNTQREEGGHLLLTMTRALQSIDFALPDLASRLRSAPQARIDPPDDMLLEAMLVKLFNDRQLHISTDVLKYILPRIERSYKAAQDLVTRADAAALAGKRAVTIPLIKEIMD